MFNKGPILVFCTATYIDIEKEKEEVVWEEVPVRRYKKNGGTFRRTMALKNKKEMKRIL